VYYQCNAKINAKFCFFWNAFDAIGANATALLVENPIKHGAEAKWQAKQK
jgi:hypothetical protein